MTDVKTQYELYPYPLRDPQDERTILHKPSSLYLATIDHAVFGGR
jgi:hypothetical protein